MTSMIWLVIVTSRGIVNNVLDFWSPNGSQKLRPITTQYLKTCVLEGSVY